MYKKNDFPGLNSFRKNMESADFFHIIFERIRCRYIQNTNYILYYKKYYRYSIHIGPLIIIENSLQITVVC